MAIIRTIGWLGVVAATLGAWGLRRAPSDPFDGLEVVRNASFATVQGRSLGLDLILPPRLSEADPPRPLAIAVHGGGWTGGARRDYGPQFADLARLGLAVAVIDYRPARPVAPSWNGAMRDVLAAVDWLLDRADRFGLDPERVATLGTSSGGLLALRAAQEDRRIVAFMGLSTPTDLAALVAGRRLRFEPARTFLGVDPIASPAVASDASPIDHVSPDGPAVLLIHGEDDAWVPVDQARRLHEKLEAEGVSSQLLILPKVRHGFELKVGAPVSRDLVPLISDFLRNSGRKGKKG